MRIIIPMAGFGTRLRPLTWSKPKPLVNVAGKAVLGHVLDSFASLPDIEEVTFIVGYLGSQVEEYVQQHYPQLRANYVPQEEMIGQSHAIWLARESLSGRTLISFLDTLGEAELSPLVAEGVAGGEEPAPPSVPTRAIRVRPRRPSRATQMACDWPIISSCGT